jgi:transposase
LLDPACWPVKAGQHGKTRRLPEFCKVLDLADARRPIPEAGTALGISAPSIYTWRRQDRIDKRMLPGLNSHEHDELVAVRHRIAQLETILMGPRLVVQTTLATTRRAAEPLKKQAPS